MKSDLPTAAELRKLLSYDPSTGELRWKPRPEGPKEWNTQNAGKVALNTLHSDGYRMGKIKGIRMYAHRVAWVLHNGQWPKNIIDHINGDRSDNRISNLRDASASDNAKNVRNQKRKSGIPCVLWVEGAQKWRVRTNINGVRRQIGSFHCIGHAMQSLNHKG